MHKRNLMFNIKKFLYFFFFLLHCSPSIAALEPPELLLNTQCINVHASWNNVAGATGYELWYQPIDANQDWDYIDLSSSTELSTPLWNGANYYIALAAYNAQEVSEFSPIELLTVGDFLLPPIQKISINNLNATISWNQIDNAEKYELWYSIDSLETWNQVEFDKNTHSISIDLWEGAYIQTTMSSIGKHDSFSRFSEIIDIAIGGKPNITASYENTLYPIDVIDVFPASTASPYAPILQNCVYSKTRTQSCKLSTLPLLGQEFPAPSINNILDRTLVSHDWMTERFEQFLHLLPPDSLKLFRAVTAVVISADIRPAYYDASTGAVYLDSQYFVIKSDPKSVSDTVDQTPDYREGCSDSLNFNQLFRYIKNGDYAYFEAESERTINDVLLLAGQVLFHELAHANDYFPPSSLGQLDFNMSVHEAADNNIKNRVSHQLTQFFPLSSDVLKYLADVMYDCSNSTCQQISYTADGIANEFIYDGANDTYNYNTVYEDLAMLSEEAMMLYFFGVERDIALTNAPTNKQASDDEYIVAWGQRHRISAPNIKNKIKFIMSQLIPEIDFASYIDNAPAPTDMIIGKSWNENITLGNNKRSKKSRPHKHQQPTRHINYQ